jgi:hypothetical protein
MSKKIIGYTVGTTLPKPSFAQTDPRKGDYIKDKEVLDSQFVKLQTQELTQEQKEQARQNIDAASQPEVKSNLAEISDAIAQLSEDVGINYNESIIGLSVDGNVITYIKGDGSEHTIITQDTDTTYSLGTDTTTGLTKLYATTGSAEDGTMTQRAIKTELDKKVGVDIDSAQNTLIFTI